jgi:hypothetical protein
MRSEKSGQLFDAAPESRRGFFRSGARKFRNKLRRISELLKMIIAAIVILSAIGLALKRKMSGGGVNASPDNPPPPAQALDQSRAQQVNPNAEGAYFNPPGPAPLQPVEVYRYVETISPGNTPFGYNRLQSGTGALPPVRVA